MSFAYIFVWQDFFQFSFEQIGGNLCVFAAEQAGTFLFLPPLGKTIATKAVQSCFERMQCVNKKTAVSRIENVSLMQLAAFLPENFEFYKRGYEYLYFRKDLAALRAEGYKSKRNAYNHFVKNFTYQYRPYDVSMAEECLELYDSWKNAKRAALTQEVDLALLEDSQLVHRRILMDFARLNVVGRVVEVNGKIAAYTFGYFVGSQSFCVLLEVADSRYRGLATYIFCRLCQDPLLQEAKFINAMDDFALQNVNRTKMSFRPCALLPVYAASLAQERI